MATTTKPALHQKPSVKQLSPRSPVKTEGKETGRHPQPPQPPRPPDGSAPASTQTARPEQHQTAVQTIPPLTS